jgi:leucyl aminopeptidase
MKILSSDQRLNQIQTDALVLCLFQDEDLYAPLEKLNKSISSSFTEAMKLGDFKGKLYEVTPIYTHGKVPAVRVFLVGMGKKVDFDQRVARNVAGAAARRARKIGVKKLAFYLRSELGATEVIEGVGLANFDGDFYKSKKDDGGDIEELLLIGKVNEQAIKRSSILIESTNWVRKMISEPANMMTPAKMVEEARKLAKEYKFDLEVIDERQAKQRGFGAFVGVAKGSGEPSYLVVLKYKGKGGEKLGLVGKGITFDSGGISIKPGERMHEMKYDMAGAAACFGAMRVVGETKPKASVTMVTPLTENLPGGKALKPGDLLKSLSGKTIEVLNTDAEGRLVLSDALTYAQKLGATKIVDLATLTGAAIVALGHEAAAVLGNKQNWVDQVISAGRESGERYWQLPLFLEHKEFLKSDVADMANIPPSRGAGVIAGAVFLQEFIEEKNSWAHLDIAATAWLDGEKPFMAKGATGFGVRTLVKLIEDLEKADS